MIIIIIIIVVVNNINCAGHFTLDALASRTVACNIIVSGCYCGMKMSLTRSVIRQRNLTAWVDECHGIEATAVESPTNTTTVDDPTAMRGLVLGDGIRCGPEDAVWPETYLAFELGLGSTGTFDGGARDLTGVGSLGVPTALVGLGRRRLTSAKPSSPLEPDSWEAN